MALAYAMVQLGYAAPPILTLNASKNTGKPGDEIVFSWKVEANGNRVRDPRVRVDGETLKVKSPYTWKMTPGTHVVYLEMAWKKGLKDLPLSAEEEKKKAGLEKKGKKFKRPSMPYITATQLVEITPTASDFVHPGLYSSAEELDAIRRFANQKGSHPIKDAIPAFLKCSSGSEATNEVPYASLDWKPHAVSIAWPKSDDKAFLFGDGRAVYAHALLWVITGKQEHADKAIEILNAWSSIFKDMRTKNGDIYASLFGSWTANHWVAGAEIIRYYKLNGKSAGWEKEDVLKFEKMCRVFERLMLQWNGGANTYGLQNQRLAVSRTCMALGVFMNDQDLFNHGAYLIMDKMYSGKSTVKRHGHPVNLVGLTIASDGEIMEFNRDAAHGRGSLNVLVTVAEIFRHQRVDEKYKLYDLKLDGEKIPRLLKGAEYAVHAYYNSPIDTSKVKGFVNDSSGSHSEMIVNYYKYIKKDQYALPENEKVNLESRPKDGATYIIPWTTITHGFDFYRKR